MEMVNGYVFLDLTKSNVYSKALKVLGTDKPVVIKDGQGSPYFVDSLTLSGTNIIITKGGKTITIANDNTITNEGDIQIEQFNFNEYVRKGVQFTLNNVTNDNVIVKYLQNVDGTPTIITDTINANSAKTINGYIAFIDIPDDFTHGLDNFQPSDTLMMTLTETGGEGLSVYLSDSACDIVLLGE